MAHILIKAHGFELHFKCTQTCTDTILTAIFRWSWVSGFPP